MRWWRLARTRNPRTFTAKVRYKMLRDHRPLLVTFADKAAVRDHVRDVLGDGHLPRVHALLDDPAGLVDLELPAEYVVKPTHGSGALVVVSADAPPDERLPDPRYSWVARHVRPENVDRAELAAVAAGWTAQRYGRGPNHEWAYGPVPRRVIVEELLRGPDGAVPDDYKLFVFHGRCHFVQVDTGRFGDRTQDFYDRSWHHLDLFGGPAWSPVPQPRPPELDDMVGIAETLGRDTDFVRVDLYRVGGRVLVGELTSYPAGGRSPFSPVRWDATFGAPWTVPRRYARGR